MKKYHVHRPFSDDDRIVRIVNDDEDPIIEYIQCKFYHSKSPGAGHPMWALEIRFKHKAETKEMRQQFLNIEPNSHLMMDVEHIVNQEKMDMIIKYLKLAQTIDSIPLQALVEVMDLIPQFDISQLLNHGMVQRLAEEGKHVDALRIALEADSKGDKDALALLANIYDRIDDFDNYRNVLKNIPSTNESFIDANMILHNHLQENPIAPNTPPEEKTSLLEQKFRYAMNAQLTGEATHYYDELCGNSGMNPEINNIKGDVDTLILIAKKHREMKAEIANLKKQIMSEKTEQKPGSPRVGKLF